MTHAAASAVAAAGTFSCLVIFDHLADHRCYDEEEHQSHNKSTHNQFSFLCKDRPLGLPSNGR